MYVMCELMIKELNNNIKSTQKQKSISIVAKQFYNNFTSNLKFIWFKSIIVFETTRFIKAALAIISS